MGPLPPPRETSPRGYHDGWHHANSVNITFWLKIPTPNFYRYTNLTVAAKEKDGLAVLGFFFEIDEDGKDYEIFKKLNTPLKTVKPKTNTKKEIQHFNLKKFLPDNPEKEDFYRYTGSLTTPGCNEVVTWTVFKGPSISFQTSLTNKFTSHIYQYFLSIEIVTDQIYWYFSWLKVLVEFF